MKIYKTKHVPLEFVEEKAYSEISVGVYKNEFGEPLVFVGENLLGTLAEVKHFLNQKQFDNL